MDVAIPQWLADIWYVYGDILTPILQMATTILVTIIGVHAKKQNSAMDANASAMISLLKSMVEKTNTEADKKASENGEKIDDLKGMFGSMMSMFALAFSNSNLDPEIKEKINSIADTIRYGTSDEIVASLKEQIAELTQQLITLKEQVEAEEPEQVTETTETEAEPEEPTAVRM